MRHDTFIGVTWLFHMSGVTHSYVWRDSFICVTWLIQCVTWLIPMRDMTHSNMCNRTHPIMQYDSFACVTWLIHMCDMTDLYVWHDSFTCALHGTHMVNKPWLQHHKWWWIITYDEWVVARRWIHSNKPWHTMAMPHHGTPWLIHHICEVIIISDDEWVVARRWRSRRRISETVARRWINEIKPWHTYAHVTDSPYVCHAAYTWTCHVTRKNESCRACTNEALTPTL